jgi:hypothetical protein
MPRLVARDRAEDAPDHWIPCKLGLPRSNQRAERLPDAAFDGILGRDGFERANRVALDAWPRGRSAVARREAPGELGVADLVAHRALRSAHERSRRAVLRELARERRERMDRSGLEVGYAREVRTNPTPADRATALQARRSTANADAGLGAYDCGLCCYDIAVGADFKDVLRDLERIAAARVALGEHLVAAGSLMDT